MSGPGRCAWRLLPKCFPPWETVYWHWVRWNTDGTADRFHDALRDAQRREPMASTGIIDSQSLRAANTVAAAQRGYDAGKRTSGTKRHVVVGTSGCCWSCWCHCGQRGRARRVGAGCWSGCGRAMPSVAVVFVFTQGGYAGCLVHWARRVLRVAIEIVRMLLTSKVSRSCRGWDGTHIELADALPAAGPRLRTAPRKPRGHGQVDHDRTDYDPRTGTRTRTTPLDAARPP